MQSMTHYIRIVYNSKRRNNLLHNSCLIAGEIAVYSIAWVENSSNQQDPPLTNFENRAHENLLSPKRSNNDSDETYDELNRNR